MSDLEKVSEDKESKLGFIGYFDLLGYKSINPTGEMISAVKIIQKIVENAIERKTDHEDIMGQKYCDCVAFADSILVYTTFSESEHNQQHRQAAIFLEFCSEVVNELFWEGLPVRGALTFGSYYVEKTESGIYIAGVPIVEAYEFSSCLDLAGCAIGPSAEKILSPPLLGLIQYPVPCKGNRNQNVFLLNHYKIDLNYNPSRKISRQIVMDKFAAHNKRIGIEVLAKVNNTLGFLEACLAA